MAHKQVAASSIHWILIPPSNESVSIHVVDGKAKPHQVRLTSCSESSSAHLHTWICYEVKEKMFSDTFPLVESGKNYQRTYMSQTINWVKEESKTRDRFKRIFCGNFPFKNVLKPLIHSSKLIPFTLSSLKSLESNVRNVIPACKSCPQWCRWWSGGVCGRTSGTLNDPSWRWGRPLPDIHFRSK